MLGLPRAPGCSSKRQPQRAQLWLTWIPGGALRRLYAQRRPVYQELAQVVVDVDRLAPVTVVERLLAALSSDARR